MDLAFYMMNLVFQHLTKYLTKCPLQYSAETSIVSLENVYYFIYIMTPVFSAATFLVPRLLTPYDSTNLLYLKFEDKTNIMQNMYKQIYLLFNCIGFTMFYIFYYLGCFEVKDKILDVIILIIIGGVIYILMEIIAMLEIKKLLINTDSGFKKVEKKFSQKPIIPIISYILIVIILLLKIDRFINFVIIIIVMLLIFLQTHCSKIKVQSYKPIDYKNCDNIKIYLKNKEKPLEFKEDLKEGNFMMVIFEDEHVRISDKKVTRIQDIAPERIEKIEFLYLDEQLNITLEYNKKEWIIVKYNDSEKSSLKIKENNEEDKDKDKDNNGEDKDKDNNGEDKDNNGEDKDKVTGEKEREQTR